MLRQIRWYYWPLLFVVFIVIVVLMLGVSETGDERSSGIVATGATEGTYHKFVTVLSEKAEFEISPRTTGGSAENLDLLRKGEVNFALVQNDLAQYARLGIRGRDRFEDISYVIPLFPEFVQVIVAENSDIRLMSDLRGREICVGGADSGTFYNSVDVLNEGGLREGVDYMAITRPSYECLDEMINGRSIAAVFLTSSEQIAKDDTRYRQLTLSDSIVEALVAEYPYFRVLTPAETDLVDQPQLAVDAYLATRVDESSANVEQLTSAILDNWPAMQIELPHLRDIKIPDVRETIPYHAAASTRLEEAGLRKFDWLIWALGVAWIIWVVISVVVEGWKLTYDRTGQNPNQTGWRKYAIGTFGFSSKPVIISTSVIVTIILSVMALRYVEDVEAVRNGAVSPFAELDLVDSFVWLFVYIGSGFTADNIYPVSFAGKAITGILAVGGIVAPLGIVVFLINLAARRSQLWHQGFGSINFAGHAIICGWNEKAPGIIYTLTGKNVEKPMKVAVVADLDGAFPLDEYKFDPAKVGYCKGSATDKSVLHRARIKNASAVIVLAEFGGNDSHNKSGILSTLSVRNLNSAAHLCAELEYLDNVDLFNASGCQTLIHDDLVINRLAVMAILSTDLVDYLLDMVTYSGRDHDELYSVSAGKLMDRLNLTGICEAELRADRLCVGANIVGVLQGSMRTAPFDSSFGLGPNQDGMHTLVDKKHRFEPLKSDSMIVYSARSESEILRRRRQNCSEPITQKRLNVEPPSKLSVLVCADRHALDTIRVELETVVQQLEFVEIDLDTDRPRMIEDIDQLIPAKLDVCILLQRSDIRSDLNSMRELNDSDTDMILLTRLFDQVRESNNANLGNGSTDWRIVTEVGNRLNKRLIEDSGADYVLPGSMMIERLLAKEVYDKNHVTDFLMAAMRLDDGVHLHRHIVQKGDGFCGERFDRILATEIEGLRIMGWRPGGAEMANKERDFGFHYHTVIDERGGAKYAEEGDIIIMTIRHLSEYWAKNDVPAAPD